MTERELLELILSEIKSLKQGQGKLEDQVTDMQGQISDMKGQIADLRGEMTDMKGQIADLRGEMTDMKGQIADMRGEMTTMKGQIAEMQGQIADMQGQVSDMQKQITNISLHLENTTDKNIRILAENHSNLVDKLNQAIKVDNETTIYKLQVTTLERRVDKLEKAMEDLQNKIA